jgi:hypothetical protein
MRHSLLVLVSVSLISCFDDPGYDKTQFASEVAKVHCDWLFTCCDNAEQKDRVTATTELECVSQMTTTYLGVYSSADARVWNAQAAKGCVDALATSASACSRGFDPSSVAFGCQIVPTSKTLGQLCNNAFECTSKFCKSNICAEPFTDGMTCTTGDVCAGALRCVGGKCTSRKPDGSSCTSSDECVSAQCGGGKCYYDPAGAFTCDGKN